MRRPGAFPVYLGLQAFGSLAGSLTFTVTAVYYVRELGMSPFLLVLCGTAMELAIFVFEVPTGVVADAWSRRGSIVISYLVMGTAMIGFALVGAALALVMPETRVAGGPGDGGEQGLRSFAATARAGTGLVRGRPVLLLMLAIFFCFGMWSESFDRLWQAHVLAVGVPELAGLDPAVWFGILGAASLVSGIALNGLVARRIDAVSQATLARALLAGYAATLVAALGFALAGAFWVAAVAWLAVAWVRTLVVPATEVWLNRSLDDSSTRATVNSIASQADAVGQWTGGPGLGAVGSLVSIRAALAVGGFCLAPALALFGRAIRHHGREPELVPDAV